MAHRFRTIPKGNTTERGYGHQHMKARRAAATTHQPTDPCSICRQPLGPMGPWLHYDHTPNRDGYRGFAHAPCNRRDGAQRGNTRQRLVKRAPRAPRRRDWYGNEITFGECVVCGTMFPYSHPDQKTCGRTCGVIYRYGRGPICRVRYAACRACGRDYVQRRSTAYCSDACRDTRYPFTRRGTDIEISCRDCSRVLNVKSSTRPPTYCADCRAERKRRAHREAKQRAKQRDPNAWRERKRAENQRAAERRRGRAA